MIRIGCWNIHGLNVSKLDDVTKICSKYDIMCFLETMSKESPGNIPGFTAPFVVSAKKKAKKRGRSSGGILVYAKPILRQHVKMLKGSDATLWIRIVSENVGLKYGGIFLPSLVR